MGKAEEIADLKRRVAELEKEDSPLEAIEQPCEVTVGIHTCDALFRTCGLFWGIVQMLCRQGLPLGIITTDNMSVNGEGTVGLLTDWQKTRYWQRGRNSPIREFHYLGQFPKQSRIPLSVAFGKAKILERVTTPYVFWLDQDVMLWPGDLSTLLAEFKGGEKLGALGIPYTAKIDHVQFGALLMETETCRKVGFDGRGRCGCVNMAKMLAAEGLSMKYWSGGFARHVSREV